jgi:hypothetical protein
MFVKRYEVSITVDASGNGTGYTDEPVRGFVRAIRYVPDGSNPYDTGVDPTITGEVSGLAIWSMSNMGTVAVTVYPRAATVSVANSAALYASGGTAVNDLIPIADERIKVALAQGGNATTGKFHIWVG